MNGNNYSTVDLQRSRPRLRADLLFVPQRYQGTTYYHIESPTTSAFYRIGYAEYVFLSLLDGETTFAEALAQTARQLGSSALTSQEALRTYMWLLENKLGQLEEPAARTGVSDQPGGSHRELARNLNPFWLKLPLCKPDRAVSALVPLFGWCFSPAMMLVGAALVVSALVAVASHWERFLVASEFVFSPTNWLWMGITWVSLKLVHEFAHAIACRRYGCEVREMGLVLVLFAPLAYVDVTSSWRLPSKWQRMQVAVAGMYVELVTAALATFVWLHTDSQLASHVLYNLMVMASISTIAFNANPLMRFDGYFLLSDLLELPNLYAAGSRAVHRQVVRCFFGQRIGEPEHFGPTAWFVAVYGWLAMGWRILVCASLTLVASVLFHGAGVVIAAVGLFSWFGQPMVALGQELWQLAHESPRACLRATVLSMTLAGGAIWLLIGVPAPVKVCAPGVVEYRDVVHLRSMTSGFVREVLVADGAEVQAGEILVRLANRDVSNEYHDLLLSIEQSLLRERMAMDERDAALAQVERRNQMALRQQLAEAKRRYEALEIRAPISGKVVGRGLAQLQDTHLEVGDVLLSMGEEAAKELVVSVGEEDFDNVIPHVGESVTVRLGSLQRVEGSFLRLEPRATLELPHPALSASEGGELVVARAETRDGDQQLDLTAPRFRGIVSLPAAHSDQMFSGQRAMVSFGWHRESIGVACYQSARNWVARKLMLAKS